jgi:lipopolysaccharide biosynthesis glycosyltransferase
MHRIFVGFDSREPSAYDVAVHSLRKHSVAPLLIEPLKLLKLEQQRLMNRPRVMRDGKMYDLISQAHMSTEFAITRFLPPLLAQKGWVMFADSDIVALHDVAELFAQRDDSKAVMVVKHAQTHTGVGTKMDGQVQYYYERKNWSSVMLFNCDHPANDALTLELINTVPGRDLHAFCWLADQHIGELDPEWNWLVGVQPARSPKLAHFTLGGPWFENWNPRVFDDIWLTAAKEAGVQVLSSGAAVVQEKEA